MKKKHALALLYAMFGLLVVALAVQILQEKSFTASMAVRTLIPMGLCLGAIWKVNGSAAARQMSFYEAQYKDTLRLAFAEEHRLPLRKKLLDAIDLYNADQYEKALAVLRTLLESCKKADDYTAVLMFMALCYTDLGRGDDAMNCYRSLLAHDSQISRAWSNLGMLYKKQGNHLAALDCYDQALRLDGNNPYAYNNMAAVYFALGEYRRAIGFADQALERKGDLWQAASTACLACCGLELFDKAEEYRKISIANGADAKALQATMERISSGGHHRETLVSYSAEVKKAANAFARATARPHAGAGIPFEDNRSHFGGAVLGQAPLDANGKPMRLLCALYCSELSNVADMPEKGLLLFYLSEKGLHDTDFDHPTRQTNFRVIYSESEDLSEGPEPEDYSMFPVKGCYHIRFYPGMCYLSCADYRFEKTMDRHLQKEGAPCFRELEEDVQESLRDQFSSEGHRVGGYPHFAQEDPRGASPELQKYDTMLLQIDSHDDFVEIGQSGVINFFIPREKLKAKDFSDVLFCWDCY